MEEKDISIAFDQMHSSFATVWELQYIFFLLILLVLLLCCPIELIKSKACTICGGGDNLSDKDLHRLGNYLYGPPWFGHKFGKCCYSNCLKACQAKYKK